MQQYSYGRLSRTTTTGSDHSSLGDDHDDDHDDHDEAIDAVVVRLTPPPRTLVIIYLKN
jgi:hypothetical protein